MTACTPPEGWFGEPVFYFPLPWSGGTRGGGVVAGCIPLSKRRCLHFRKVSSKLMKFSRELREISCELRKVSSKLRKTANWYLKKNILGKPKMNLNEASIILVDLQNHFVY
jgi:hypothetical protein